MTLSNSIPAVSTAATVLLVAYNNLRKRCFQFGNFVSFQNVRQSRNDFDSYSSQFKSGNIRLGVINTVSYVFLLPGVDDLQVINNCCIDFFINIILSIWARLT